MVGIDDRYKSCILQKGIPQIERGIGRACKKKKNTWASGGPDYRSAKANFKAALSRYEVQGVLDVIQNTAAIVGMCRRLPLPESVSDQREDLLAEQTYRCSRGGRSLVS